MTNRLDYRTRMRTILDDTSLSPLWSDGQLNECLAQAAEEYSVLNPIADSYALTTTAADVLYALPAGVDPYTVVDLYDGADRKIPQRAPGEGAPPASETNYQQAFFIEQGKIRLHRQPAGDAGTWALQAFAPRLMPSDDVTPYAAPAGHDLAIVLLACAAAVQLRLTDAEKRAPEGQSSYWPRQTVAKWRANARRIVKRNRIKVGSMTVS